MCTLFSPVISIMFGVLLILLVSLLPISLTNLFAQEKWEKFKTTYDKSYGSEEEPLRYEIFKNNLEHIELHNKKFQSGESTYKLGVNKFADVSLEEFQSPMRRFKNQLNISRLSIVKYENVDDDDDDVPESMDWRELGAVTDVKDERIYYEGYGWAFSVVGAFEAQVYLAIQTLIPLSVQQLIDCADPNLTSDYFFGMLDFAYYYVANQSNGILTEEEYPYTGQKDTCHKEVLGILCGLFINTDDEYEMRNIVGNKSPVSVVIDASRLANYEGGIIDNMLCNNGKDDVNHAVLVVGYGVENDVDYWLLKNSWGADWGEDGYFRIKRFDNNTCGIAWSITYPRITYD